MPVGTCLRAYLAWTTRSSESDSRPTGPIASAGGIAREVALPNRLAVTAPDIEPGAASPEDTVTVELQGSERCPRHVGRVIRRCRRVPPSPCGCRKAAPPRYSQHR